MYHVSAGINVDPLNIQSLVNNKNTEANDDDNDTNSLGNNTQNNTWRSLRIPADILMKTSSSFSNHVHLKNKNINISNNTLLLHTVFDGINVSFPISNETTDRSNNNNNNNNDRHSNLHRSSPTIEDNNSNISSEKQHSQLPRLFRDRSFRKRTLVPAVPSKFVSLLIPVVPDTTKNSSQTSFLFDFISRNNNNNSTNNNIPKNHNHQTQFLLHQVINRLNFLFEGFFEDGTEREIHRRKHAAYLRKLREVSNTAAATNENTQLNAAGNDKKPLVDVTILFPQLANGDDNSNSAKNSSTVTVLLDFGGFNLLSSWIQDFIFSQQQSNNDSSATALDAQFPKNFHYSASDAALDFVWHVNNDRSKLLAKQTFSSNYYHDASNENSNPSSQEGPNETNQIFDFNSNINYYSPIPCDGRCALALSCDLRPASATGIHRIEQLLDDYFELPTCICCIDRIESTTTGVARDLCACPSSRCNCLMISAAAGCFNCRHVLIQQQLQLLSKQQQQQQQHNRHNLSLQCECCASTNMDDLWTCCVCGAIGCSRYRGQHAKRHYEFSGHEFSLNLMTQQIWDYSCDEFVHRWIAKTIPNNNDNNNNNPQNRNNNNNNNNRNKDSPSSSRPSSPVLVLASPSTMLPQRQGSSTSTEFATALPAHKHNSQEFHTSSSTTDLPSQLTLPAASTSSPPSTRTSRKYESPNNNNNNNNAATSTSGVIEKLKLPDRDVTQDEILGLPASSSSEQLRTSTRNKQSTSTLRTDSTAAFAPNLLATAVKTGETEETENKNKNSQHSYSETDFVLKINSAKNKNNANQLVLRNSNNNNGKQNLDGPFLPFHHQSLKQQLLLLATTREGDFQNISYFEQHDDSDIMSSGMDAGAAVKYLVDAKMETKTERLCNEYSRQLMIQLDNNRNRLTAQYRAEKNHNTTNKSRPVRPSSNPSPASFALQQHLQPQQNVPLSLLPFRSHTPPISPSRPFQPVPQVPTSTSLQGMNGNDDDDEEEPEIASLATSTNHQHIHNHLKNNNANNNTMMMMERSSSSLSQTTTTTTTASVSNSNNHKNNVIGTTRSSVTPPNVPTLFGGAVAIHINSTNSKKSHHHQQGSTKEDRKKLHDQLQNLMQSKKGNKNRKHDEDDDNDSNINNATPSSFLGADYYSRDDDVHSPTSSSNLLRTDPSVEYLIALKDFREALSHHQQESEELHRTKQDASTAEIEASDLHHAVKRSMEVKHAYDTQLKERIKSLKESIEDMKSNVAYRKKLVKQGFVAGGAQSENAVMFTQNNNTGRGRGSLARGRR